MIVLLRSTDGQPDSRFEKYIDFLERKGIPNITICWDRTNIKTPSLNRLFYRKVAKYGLGLRNIIGLIGFNWFILKNLIRRRKEYNIIHAADFDTIIPAILMKFFYGKKVIYDIYDWYIDSREIKNGFLKWIIMGIEKINVKQSDVVIICEKGRQKQIIFTPKKLWILPNIPNIKMGTPLINELRGPNLTISYVGILSEGRGLKNLINLAFSRKDINFVIGGFGPMEKDFTDASKLPNFDFKGRVSYEEALRIMKESDLIYAMYERINPNHILAAPNKYYEGLALGRPIITTVGTLVGDKVMEYNTGYCIDEKNESLDNLISKLNKDELSAKSHNASIVWETKYKDYVDEFFENNYLEFIQSN